DHDHHHGPHESPKLILVPIAILAFFAVTAGFVNATPLAVGGSLGPEFGEDIEYVKTYVEPRATPVPLSDVVPSGPGESLVLYEAGFVEVSGADAVAADEGEGGKRTGCGFDDPLEGTLCFFPAVSHAVPTTGKILLSLGVVALGYAIAIAFCVAYYGRRDERLVGLTERNGLARGGYKFLANKYYLDHLYENVIVRAVAYPISKGAYWANQHLLDGAVNGIGEGGKRTGQWVYKNVDQGLVDGAVNGSGTVATGTGEGLSGVQSGKVNLYGALIFGAAAVGAIVLVIVNVG
ncbi:MAG: hypothetical protein AAFP84_06775, partial [Actinomycetota bacterium]